VAVSQILQKFDKLCKNKQVYQFKQEYQLK